MALVNIGIPKEYGYVVLTTASTFAVQIWLSFRIGSFRRAAGQSNPIQYSSYTPNLEKGSSSADFVTVSAAPNDPKAKEKYMFNCAQRGLGNFLEHYPTFLPALLIAGLRWPIASSVLGLVWTLGRVLYATGYTNPTKTRGEGRYLGLTGLLAQYVLGGMCVWFGVEIVRN